MNIVTPITSFNFLCIFKCPTLCPCVRHVQTAPNDHSFTFCALFPLISTFLFTVIILSDKLYSDMNFTTNSGPESHLLMTKESMRICDNEKGTSVWCSLWNYLSADIINLNESGKHPIQIRLLGLATVFTNCMRSHISDLCHFHSYNCIWQWGLEQQMLIAYCWLSSLGSIHCRHVWSWTFVRISWKSTAVTHTSPTNFFSTPLGTCIWKKK